LPFRDVHAVAVENVPTKQYGVGHVVPVLDARGYGLPAVADFDVDLDERALLPPGLRS